METFGQIVICHDLFWDMQHVPIEILLVNTLLYIYSRHPLHTKKQQQRDGYLYDQHVDSYFQHHRDIFISNFDPLLTKNYRFHIQIAQNIQKH